jgi:hypothetical protein
LSDAQAGAAADPTGPTGPQPTGDADPCGRAGAGAVPPVAAPVRSLERSPDRYGRRARPRDRRRQQAAVVAAGLVAGVAVAFVAQRNLGGSGISGTVTAFDISADHVDLRFTVDRDRPDDPAACFVRARAEHGDEVGHARVPVRPGGGRHLTLTYRLHTSGRAVTGEVYRCRYGSER